MSDTPISTLLARFNPSLASAIPVADRRVIKRDGTTVPWDANRITRAVAHAFYDVLHHGAENPHRDDPAARFGLDEATMGKVQQITARTARTLELIYRAGRHSTIEQIQDTVEKAIAAEGEWDVARSYIIYRERQAAHRLNHYAENGLSDYIAISKYARYRRELGRRESFAEAARRVLAMHLEHFKDRLPLRLPPPEESSPVLPADRRLLTEWLAGGTLSDALHRAFGAVARKRVLPSMRSLQFGGEAILKNHARLFNCSFSPVDRIEFFREYFFLLLAGTGCGFSVQRHHVDRLPALPVRGEEMELPVRHHAIADTIEGWADALHFLVTSHLERFKVEFNYSAIRPRGSTLRTAGGKAPGHLPLKQALLEAEAILLGAAGRKLRPIEVYDICMDTARAVLSGGIRRSATICLFSPDDQEMMDAKTGNWFEKHPQRSASNNSAVLARAGTDLAQFQKLFHAQKEFGEPGFYFADNQDYGCNPCCEIGLHPVIEGPLADNEAAKLRALGYSGPLEAATRLSGWQMCVAGDTPLLTDDGITNIREAVGKKIKIWNGREWATVKPFVTGQNRTLYRVHLSDGSHLDCTAEHNWAVRLYGSTERKLSTSQLRQSLAKGTRLSIPRAKVVHPKVGVSIAHAYEYGFVLGDGTATGDRVPFATCFKEEALLRMDGTYGQARVSGVSRTECKNIYFHTLDRLLAASIKEPRMPLPTELYSWDEASMLAFLAGWIDADGSKANHGCRLYGERAKLQSAQLLLTKCGINSSLNLCAPAGETVVVEGRAVKRRVDLHYLQIPNASRIPSRRLDLSKGTEPTMKGKYQTVRRIEKLGGLHTTYCFTEPKRHMGLFGNVLTYQCNLSTINGAVLQTVDDFLVACIQASVIGTIQAAYTDIPYLGPVTRYLNERDALLGVSICGFMDNPEILFNPEALERGARLCRAANEIVAQAIGIRPAARVTCVKPEGTASLLLGAASGIHPHHARHYFRRVQANRRDPVYRHFRAANPHLTEASVYRPDTDDVITFAVEAPAHAILRDEVGAVDFLRFVQLVQRHWVLGGEAAGTRSPGLHHNVSNTCSVKPGEWDAVADFIWQHREDFTGVALLGYEGDKRYPQAPREEVSGEEDIAKWNRLRYEPVNYTRLEEATDETKLKEVAACAGGACELT